MEPEHDNTRGAAAGQPGRRYADAERAQVLDHLGYHGHRWDSTKAGDDAVDVTLKLRLERVEMHRPRELLQSPRRRLGREQVPERRERAGRRRPDRRPKERVDAARQTAHLAAAPGARRQLREAVVESAAELRMSLLSTISDEPRQQDVELRRAEVGDPLYSERRRERARRVIRPALVDEARVQVGDAGVRLALRGSADVVVVSGDGEGCAEPAHERGVPHDGDVEGDDCSCAAARDVIGEPQ
ncbi:MAG TPA: hypothetical protein VF549_15475 [Solirubrobacteraceae bacterium]